MSKTTEGQKDIATSIDKPVLQLSLLGLGPRINNIFDRLRDDYVEVSCPDGTKAYILKNPLKAFEVYGKEYSVRAQAIIDLLNKLKTNVTVEIGSKIESIYENLNYIEATLSEMYKMSYITFASRPCQKEFQDAKLKADRIILVASLLLISIKIIVESLVGKDSQVISDGLDTINKKILELIDKITYTLICFRIILFTLFIIKP